MYQTGKTAQSLYLEGLSRCLEQSGYRPNYRRDLAHGMRRSDSSTVVAVNMAKRGSLKPRFLPYQNDSSHFPQSKDDVPGTQRPAWCLTNHGLCRFASTRAVPANFHVLVCPSPIAREFHLPAQKGERFVPQASRRRFCDDRAGMAVS